MIAFGVDGQLNEYLIQQQDEYYEILSTDKRKQREDIEEPKGDKGADAWMKSGKTVQLTTTETKMKLSKWVVIGTVSLLI